MQRLLIVEDQPEISVAIAEWLMIKGIACETYRTATGALRAFRATHFSAVLLDIHLGGGMTGLELAQKLRSVDEKLIIILFSAVHYSPVVRRAVDLIGGYFLEKPINMARLFELIEPSR